MLTPKEELTLMQYKDRELSYLGRLFVRRLLRRKDAQAFLNGMNELHAAVQPGKPIEGRQTPDLWSRVENRIAQEERAALFLGKRVFQPSKPRASFGGWQFTGGAAVAAGLLFLLVEGKRSEVGYSQRAGLGSPPSLSRPISGVRPVSLDEDRRVGRVARPMQVEWMKSAGRVSFIESEIEDEMAIMWISHERIPSLGAKVYSAPGLIEKADVPVLINEKLPRDVPVFAPKEEQ